MTTKFKILSAISFIALAIALTFVGVWALTDLDFTVGGNITYTAPEPEPVTPEEVSYLSFEYDDTTWTATLTGATRDEVVVPSKILRNAKEYTVTKVGDDAFCETSISSITLPDTILEIGNYAFSYTNLTEINLPEGLKKVGSSAFQSCTFDIITIPSTIEEWDSAFSGIRANSVIISYGITAIPSHAFYESGGIKSITILDSVTSIGSYAFWGCTGLTLITIPDSVTSIGYDAFEYCTGLTSITIPDSVTSIGAGAFYGCTSLVKVEVKATTPPTGGYDMFYNCPLTTGILVPSGSEDDYKSATYWKNYADYIKAGSF